MSVYPADIEESQLPDISGVVNIDEIKTVEKETLPPPRFTPASLVSLLEKKNLGTKTTRSSIVETLFERGYLDGKSIKATELGMRLVAALEKHTPIIIDENLTRQLEEEMEKIQELDKDLYEHERRVIDKAKEIIAKIAEEFKKKEKDIGIELLKGLESLREEQNKNNELMPCTLCKNGMLRILYSKKTRRAFIGCSAYPACTQTFSLPPNALIKKAEGKKCEADGFQKLLAIRKAKRPWEFCFNPDCSVEKQKREEWQARKNKNASES
jgi:DNA topoisomerase-1